MSHKPVRNVTQAGPKCHTRAKISHSHVIMLHYDVAWSVVVSHEKKMATVTAHGELTVNSR